MLKRETWFKLVVVSAVLPACGDGGGTTAVTGATEATEPSTGATEAPEPSTGTTMETPTSGTPTSGTPTSSSGTTAGPDATSTGEAITEGSTTAADTTTGDPFVCPDGAGPFIGGPVALTLGEAATIEGCRFGVPKDDAPLVWDDFEGGVTGEPLRDHSAWQPYSGDGARYTDDDAFSGGLAAQNEVFVGNGQSFATNYQEVPTSEAMYVSYRFRVKITGNPYGVLKLSRIASNYDGELPHVDHYNGPGSMVWTYQPDSQWSYASFNSGAGEDVQKTVGDVIHEWHRVEMFIRASTPGEPDGKMWAAQNGHKLWEDDAAITRAAGMDFQYHSVLLGLMLANPEEDGHFWLSLDDLFFASSEARVELGDAPVFEDCSDREVQPHSAWTDGSVQITPRLGRLDGAGPLYLFVVDPEGQASAGLLVTVSE